MTHQIAKRLTENKNTLLLCFACDDTDIEKKGLLRQILELLLV